MSGNGIQTIALVLTLLGGVSACHDSSQSGRVATPDAGSADAAASSVSEDALCAADVQSAQAQAVEDRIHEKVACFSGTIFSPGSAPQARYVFDRLVGSDYEVKPCVSSQAVGQDGGGIGNSGGPLEDPAFAAKATAWEDDALRAIASMDMSCLTTMPLSPGSSLVAPVTIEVTSALGAPNEKLHQAAVACDPIPIDPETGMIIGADGSVTGTFGFSPDESACVLKALEGLTFPCLAGTSICYYRQVMAP